MNTRDLKIPKLADMECFVYTDGALFKLQAVLQTIPDDNTLPLGATPNSPYILVFLPSDIGTEAPEHLKQEVEDIYAQAGQHRLTLE